MPGYGWTDQRQDAGKMRSVLQPCAEPCQQTLHNARLSGTSRLGGLLRNKLHLLQVACTLIAQRFCVVYGVCKLLQKVEGRPVRDSPPR